MNLTHRPPSTKTKKKKCKVCKVEFEPTKPLQAVCGFGCAVELGVRNKTKREAKERTKERKEYKDARDKIKTRQDWINEAQAAVNAYCRARDLKAGRGCICCGKPFEPQRPGGSVDAGHYLGRGAYPELRFDERNIHAQRKNCNRPGGTTAASFRLGMIARVGLEVVEMLEGPHEPAKWTIDDLKSIKAEYKAKLKALVC